MERTDSVAGSFFLRSRCSLPLLLQLGLAWSAPSVSAAALPDDALIDAGQTKLQSGNVDEALTTFGQAEKAAPRDPRPRFLRGAALLKKKPRDLPGAIKAYREALALDGKLAAVHNELGAALQEAGQLDDALKEWRAAVAADPSLAEGWQNLGRAQAAKGELDAAIASWKTALRLLPQDAEVRIDYSATLRKAGKNTEALVPAREAVALDPELQAAHLNLGLGLHAAGKLDEAAAELTRSTVLQPKDPLAWWELGTVERQRKHPREALVAMETAFKIRPSPSIVAEFASLMVEQGDGPRAESTVRAQIAKSPRSLSLQLALATTLAAEKKCGEALQLLAAFPTDPKIAPVAEQVKKACPAAKAPPVRK